MEIELTVSSHGPTCIHIATSTILGPTSFNHSPGTTSFLSHPHVSSCGCTTCPAHQSLSYGETGQPLTTIPAAAQRTDVPRYLSDHTTFPRREENQEQAGSSFFGPSPIIAPTQSLLSSSAPIDEQQAFASEVTSLPIDRYLREHAASRHVRQSYSIPSRSISDRGPFGQRSSEDNTAGEGSTENDLFEEFTNGNDFSSVS